jgi:glutaredoxin
MMLLESIWQGRSLWIMSDAQSAESGRPAVELHSKDNCPWCEVVKSHLTSCGILFTEIQHNDRGERKAFYDSLGLEGDRRTVPQVILVVDGERTRIGGYNETLASGIESLFR